MINTLRITSGIYRGRVIETPGGATHPMGERERLALFNMISMYLQDSSVLDVFAGSGALGIEALSRGAKSVCFVDHNIAACRTIKQNATALGLESYEVIKGDAYQLDDSTKYDVVLADPPYDKYDAKKIAGLNSLVADGGVLVLSHPGEAPALPGMKLAKSRQYAGATVSIYMR